MSEEEMGMCAISDLISCLYIPSRSPPVAIQGAEAENTESDFESGAQPPEYSPIRSSPPARKVPQPCPLSSLPTARTTSVKSLFDIED